jgi:L-arabinonolactonase
VPLRIEIISEARDSLREGPLWDVGERLYCTDSGRLIRFDPNGVTDCIVGWPVQSTTSVTFGGPDLDIASVTSMARPMGHRCHHEKSAGCLFAVHGLGVRRLPERRFVG